MATTKAILTAANERFFPGAEALLKGFARHHPEAQRFIGVPECDYEAACVRFKGLATVLKPERIVEGIPLESQNKLTRLRMIDLPVDVAAYVDADAVLCRPCHRLWAVPDGTVNAVRGQAYCLLNNIAPRLHQWFLARYRHIVLARGFNSGVLALRPSDWRDLPSQFEKLLNEMGGYRPGELLDQPILNILLYGKINWLPRIYNATGSFDYTLPWNARIIHFTGDIKPWMPGFSRYEPAYYVWLRHGRCETDRMVLAKALLRIVLRSPVRLVKRYLRLRRVKNAWRKQVNDITEQQGSGSLHR